MAMLARFEAEWSGYRAGVRKRAARIGIAVNKLSLWNWG